MENISKQFTDEQSSDLLKNRYQWNRRTLRAAMAWRATVGSIVDAAAGSVRGAVDASHLTQELTRFLCSKTGAQEVLFVNSTGAALSTIAAATRKLDGNSSGSCPDKKLYAADSFLAIQRLVTCEMF